MNYSQNQKRLSTLLFHRKSGLNQLSREIAEAGPHISYNARNKFREKKKSYERAQAQYQNLVNLSYFHGPEGRMAFSVQGGRDVQLLAAERARAIQTREGASQGEQTVQFTGKELNNREVENKQVQRSQIIEGGIKSEITSVAGIQKQKQEMKTPERRAVQIPREIQADRVHNQQDDIIRRNIQGALTQHLRMLPKSLQGMIQPILQKEGVGISDDAISQLRDLYFKRNYYLAKEYKIREHKALKAKQHVVSKELLYGAPFSSHSQALEINGFTASSSSKVN